MTHKSLFVSSSCFVLACGAGENMSRESEAMMRAAGSAEELGQTRPALVTDAGRPLYVTHAFSSEIARLTINADGSLTPGPLVGTEPTPRTIVFRPNGRHAYVASARHVSVYAIRSGGALTQIQAITLGNEGVLFGAAIAPNGKTFYAAAPVDNQLFTFHISSDGRIASLAQPISIDIPKGVVVTPDGRFVYVSQGALQDEDPDTVSIFATQPDGTLQLLGTAPIGASGAGAAITPDGRFLYVTCQVSDEVFGFRIASDGGLSPLEPSSFAAPGLPEEAAVSIDGRQLYVAPPQADGLRVFSIAENGALTELADSPYPAGVLPIGIAPTPDGAFVFLSNVGGDTVQEPFPGTVTSYAVRADGGLTLLELATPTGGFSPAFQSAAVLTNQGPTAQFSTRVRAAGRATAFDATASHDSDGFVARHAWDFGDGTQLPDGGPRPVHVYARSGRFDVTLTVTDNENCSTRQIFTGRLASCNGSGAASQQRTITVPR